MTELVLRLVISGLITALVIAVLALVIAVWLHAPALLVGGTLVGMLWASLFSMTHVRKRER